MKAAVYESGVATPGVIGYPEHGENVLLSKSTLDDLIKTIVGAPVIVTHEGMESVGYVSDCFMGEDGYYTARMVLFSEEALNKLNSGWGFSTQINVLDADCTGGNLNAVPYDCEILKGDIEHLAIVEYPRHNKVKIFKRNSLGRRLSMIFNRKKNANNNLKTVEPSLVRIGDSVVEISALVDIYRNKLKNELIYFQPEDTVEIDGNEVKIEELIELYRKENLGEEYQNNEPRTDQDDKYAEESRALKNAVNRVVNTPSFRTPFKKVISGRAAYGLDGKNN